MNTRSFKKVAQSKKFGLFLIGTTLAWSLGLPLYFQMASAAALTNIKDTMVNTAPSASTNHVIVYTTINTMTGGATGTSTIQFAPGNSGGATDEFTLTSLVVGDVTISGSGTLNAVANFAACTGAASEIYPSTITNTAGNRTVNIAVCPSDTIAPQTITITLGNSRVTSPSTTGSYIVRVSGTQTDSADTRVAIVDSVSMTAKVDTSFTFTVTGLATSTAINGTSTDITTLPTAIAWNTLTVGHIYTAAQQLNVATNAKNGFTVTLVQNQNLTSSTGADIDLFIDQASTSPAVSWQGPANTLGNENTYGHYGITSEDTSLAGLAFGSDNWAGNIGSAREVFYHTAPSDGTTAHIGQTKVGFQIEIASLQEAGTDYNNVLTYVATPIF